ncbi:hypothetical protein F2Q70_00016977 [Brassica cretica]|uniref:Replication protein A 70 kDa DNA-binding subunit B/D first OB fold domain-containing protein n=1 Tax=Brassica cretica TaxID=69181 RepID=A0A8S9KR97_BRACR|nr:hypothetical protein F2Q70_00016977 [Brassica cretica]KAF2596592.1 hypothetical protein F2Q68_00009940 [Brassica cretica]
MTTYTSLSTLNPDQEDTQLIQVKLLRRWKIELSSPRLFNLKLIFVDSEGKKIQATIPHECVLYCVGDFWENNLYSVKDFRIKTNVGRTRTTDNIFKLKFTISTIVKHIPSVSTSLYFHPASFADIIHSRLDFKIAVDVIGVVVSCAPIKFLLNEETKFNDLPFLTFTLEDDRERRVECQAVGDIAVQFEKNRVHYQQSGHPEICLLLFWHINQFPDGKNEYNQVLWNPDVSEVNALRERFFALESDDSSG